MDLLGQLGGILNQFTAGQGNVEDHFDQVSTAVPQSSLTEALAAAFRSDQTPPFAQMASQMFGNANSGQQASVLNTLLASAGPALLASLAGSGKLGNLGSLLSGFGLGSGPQEVPQLSPEQAQQVSPEEVQELAKHVEHHDPSIVDRLSSVYAEHPTLIKTLGAAALTIALAKIAERHNG